MAWASSEIVAVITFLLPGFVAAAVFYSLTSHPKPGDLDKIVQALVFTMVGRAAGQGIELAASAFGLETAWAAQWDLAISVAIAVTVAFIAAWVANTDWLYAILRKIGVTNSSSHPSEWYSAFVANKDCYVVLHLKGQRRIFGWPAEWPNRPDRGHFRITYGEWLAENAAATKSGVLEVVIPAPQVNMVEFLEREYVEEESGGE